MRGDGPAVSVVIPARNAEGTLARALDSMLGQSEQSFEAIVVENGSTDATASVALEYAALGGDAAVCGWVRVAPDGTRFDSYVWSDAENAFDSLAVTCAFAINCRLVRRSLVVSAGGFDQSLRTCEDWDLWLRLARMGARFRVVDECLALYNVSPGTASLDGERMLLDGLEVIGRAHAPVARVPAPDPRFAAGRDPALLGRTRLGCACYAAGLLLGAGGDARPLVALLDGTRAPEFE